MEKLLKKRAIHDDYIKKRLEGLSIEPDKERTITNVVEDLAAANEEREMLKRENKSLKEQLDFALSHTQENQAEMSIFQTSTRPTPMYEDIDKLRNQAKSKEIYVHKLEEMLRSSFGKIEKFKEDLNEAKTQNTFLTEKNTNLNKLNEQLKKAVKKYRTKCEELEDFKFGDGSSSYARSNNVWVKESTGGITRVKPGQVIAPQSDSDSENNEANIEDVDIDVKENGRKDGEPNPDLNKRIEHIEKVIDEFAPPDDSLELDADKEDHLAQHFLDETSIIPDVDHDDGNDSVEHI